MDMHNVSNYDLLAEVIGVEDADRLYEKRTLSQLLQAGNPDPALRPLFVSLELWQRMHLQQLFSRSILESPSAIKEYLQALFATKPHEVFVVLFLDSQNRLIAVEEMFRGTLTQTSVYPREIVLRALDHQAASVILSHNHPGGNPSPSRADEMLTMTLKAALALVDVRVLDHIVIGSACSFSLAESGLM